METEANKTAVHADEIAMSPAHRIPPVAEALGYAGGALALAALMTIVLVFRQVLGAWGQAGISTAVAAAGLIGGFAIERLDEPAAKRLSQFLLAVGAAAVGCAVGFVVNDVALRRYLILDEINRAHAGEWGWFTGMLAVAVGGGVVWWSRRTWLQHLTFGVGVGMASLLVLPLLPVKGPDWGAGLTLALVGIVWGALTLKSLLPPENAGLLLSTAGVIGGIELMAISSLGDLEVGVLAWAVWLGIAVSLALIIGGALIRRYLVLGMGAAGLVGFAIQLVVSVLEIGMATPVAFLVVGLALLAAAAWLSLRFASAEKPAARILAEIAGYAGVAFAVAGAMSLLSQYWSQTSTAVRIGVPAVLAIVASACAVVVERAETDSARRLSQVLYGGAIAAVGGTVAMIVYPIALGRFGEFTVVTGYEQYIPYEDPSAWSGFAAFVAVTVAGAITWALRPGLVTQLVTGLGVWMAVQNGFGLVPQEVIPFWVTGTVMLAIGVAWALLGLFEKVRPSNTGIALGCGLAIVGVMQLMDNMGHVQRWAPWLGMALSVLAIAASIRYKRGVMLGFGAAGVVLFAFSWTQMVYEGRLAGPVILLVTGVTFIGMAVLVAVMLPRFGAGGESKGLKPPPIDSGTAAHP